MGLYIGGRRLIVGVGAPSIKLEGVMSDSERRKERSLLRPRASRPEWMQ